MTLDNSNPRRAHLQEGGHEHQLSGNGCVDVQLPVVVKVQAGTHCQPSNYPACMSSAQALAFLVGGQQSGLLACTKLANPPLAHSVRALHRKIGTGTQCIRGAHLHRPTASMASLLLCSPSQHMHRTWVTSPQLSTALNSLCGNHAQQQCSLCTFGQAGCQDAKTGSQVP